MAGSEPAILLDANVLLLAAVGLFDKALVGRKRLEIFTVNDLDLLLQLIAPFPRNLTTPHVLAEVSNLADQCVPRHRHREYRQSFADFIGRLEESWTPSVELCQTEAFKRLGLSDAGVCQLANEQTTVISADAELCSLLWARGVSAANFNHLRDP